MIGEGVTAWNRWRADHIGATPNLGGAGLRGHDLSGANLNEADLTGADLRGTNLTGASLVRADLSGANLFKAIMDETDLAGADLTGAHFLECAQLTAARNWRSAIRDEALACGAPIPEGRDRS